MEIALRLHVGFGVFCQISPYVLDRFSQSFHQMKAFWVQIIDLDLFFRYLKGLCHGNRFCEKMANSAQSSLLHSETEWDNAVYMHDQIAPLMPL